MASVRKEIVIDVPPEEAWDALRDWGAVHQRLAPGFVTDARLDGEDRIVTFGDGSMARERFVHLDEEARRLVWSVAEWHFTHHNGAAQVFAADDGRTRFVWTADFLPHGIASRIEDAMDRGMAIIKQTLEARSARSSRAYDRSG